MISFKSLRHRSIIELPESEVTATAYVTHTKHGNTRTTYAYKAVHDGEKLTRFCSRAAYENHTGPRAEVIKEAAAA